MLQLNFGYAPLDIKDFLSFEEKLEATIAHLEMNTIFCRLQENQIPDVNSSATFDVVDILVPGGHPRHVKSLLQKAIVGLKDSVDDYVSNHEDYFEIKKTLENLKDKCIFLSKKNDINKSFPYEENEIIWFAIYEGNRCRISFRQLILNEITRNEFLDHYSIRKEFFDEMIEMINKKLQEHLELPAYPKKPFQWHSDNPHLEIAELLLALQKTRIGIRKGQKGSYSKLAKEFYNLFGLDDGQYHQKLQQIRQRQTKKTWLQELPEAIIGKKVENP